MQIYYIFLSQTQCIHFNRSGHVEGSGGGGGGGDDEDDDGSGELGRHGNAVEHKKCV